MKNDFTKLMIMTRKSTGFTQEQAAEHLHISVRTLATYEQGKMPSDDFVANMMQVYGSTALGYAYLSTESAIGRLILPKIQIYGISSSALQLHINMQKVAEIYSLLEEICSDDQITPDEQPYFKKCITALDGLAATIISVKLMQTKKDRRGCTHSDLKLNLFGKSL